MSSKKKISFRMNRVSEAIYILLLVSLTGCSNPVATVRPPEPVSEEQILQAHKKLTLDEQIEIEAFVNRKGWIGMERTESGLYMLLCKDVANTAATAASIADIKYGDTVQLQLNITLLNGTEIFNGTQKIIMGKTEIIAGLREALSKMRCGENACLIIPSHLAYGFSGNGDDIPPHATLVCQLKVICCANDFLTAWQSKLVCSALACSSI
jgi:FKBP-type peptidyl-prolyl cis-trans isomerase